VVSSKDSLMTNVVSPFIPTPSIYHICKPGPIFFSCLF
jgi:hypothetical protein